MLIIIAAVLILLILWLIGLYNRIVRMINNRKNAFADVDVQLKQRYDLVPQLIETVKGYSAHEKETLQRIVDARAAAMNATDIDGKLAANARLNGALAGLKVALEAYPELKANQNFLRLQEELSDIENKLAAARRFFNSSTKELNNSIQTFPANVVAGMFGFHTEPMFEVTAEERPTVEKAPEVKF